MAENNQEKSPCEEEKNPEVENKNQARYNFNKEQFEQEYSQAVATKDSEVRKLYLYLSIVSLLIDFIYGIGVLLAIPVLVLSILKIREGKNTNTTWSITISAIATVVGLAYFLLLVVF